MSSKFVIEDWIQNNIKMNTPFMELLNNILLGILVYVFYSNVEFPIFIKFIKYYVLLLIIRFIISSITSIKDVENNKSYFQINSHIGLFLLIILLCIEENIFGLGDNYYLSLGLVLIYSLSVIVTRYAYTYDVITTILLINYIFNLEQLKPLIE
jgi:hypothetical protein